jgi:hypothetical protein
MAAFNVKDITSLFIGGAATKTTGGISTLNSAEIGLFTPAGTRLTEANAATAEEFIIVQKVANGTNVISNTIKKANIKSATRKAYTAPTEQVDYIGFNGTSGALDVINSNTYFVRLGLNQGLTSNHGGLYLKHGIYISDATATESEVAAGLAKSLVANFSRETDKSIKFERVINNTLVTLVETYSPVNGSKYVLASAASTTTVGHAFRFGTALTDPTYIVTAINNDIITLDVPFQGPSASTVTCEAAAVGALNWGIKLTGVALPFTTGKIHYNKSQWKTTIEGFTSTVITNSVGASSGSGYESAVKELEWFCQNFEGDFYTVGEPNLYPRRALASGNYDFIILETVENYQGSIVSGPINKTYMIAIPESAPNYAVAGTANDITDVLEVLAFGSATGALAIS